MLENPYLQTAPPESPEPASHEPGIIDGLLKPTALALWEYRRTLVGATVVAAVVSASAAAYLFISSPVRQVATVPFRFQFEGARNGKYPSQLPFSESDVVSPPVLTAVYERNGLSQYMPFSAFSNGLFVLRTSFEADLLSFDYQAKLSEARLPPVERARLEQEYRSKMLTAPSDYALTFVASQSMPRRPPAIVMEKTLDDVLATWAKQAIELRGALIADAELLTAGTFSDVSPGDDDVLKRIDILHGKIRRVIDNIVQLERLPGARVLHGPKSDVTLPEVRATLEDLLRYELDPLYTTTMAAGLTDQAASVQYFEGQLRRAQYDAKEALGRRQSLVDALRTYADDTNGSAPGAAPPSPGAASGQTVTAQLNETFIDRLMSLSRRQEDLLFRQDMTKRLTDASFVATSMQKEEQFYEGLLPLARSSSRLAGVKTTRQDVSAALERIQQKAIGALEFARQITSFAPEDLKGRGDLYALAGGFSFSATRSVSLNLLTSASAIAVTATLVLTAVACLGHHYIRSRRKPQFRAIASRL